MPVNPIFCAVDTPVLSGAKELANSLKSEVGGFKLGLEFFMANGAEGYRAIATFGAPIFLDVKLNDIPNTVAGAMSFLMTLQPAYISIHASGGKAMMRAAAETVARAGAARPKLLAVTVLTSLDNADLAAIGQGSDTSAQVVRLAKLAMESGIDGCVCSAEEILHIRAAVGNEPVLMVPGIRPEWAPANDQKRTLTPRQAYDAGATHIVVGRAITKAKNPVDAARRIQAELSDLTN